MIEQPGLQAGGQTYLAACEAVDKVLDDMDGEGDRTRAERSRFVMGILTSALAPTNSLVGNPAALKKTFEAWGPTCCRSRKLRPQPAPQRRDAVDLQGRDPEGRGGPGDYARAGRRPRRLRRAVAVHPGHTPGPGVTHAGRPAAHRPLLLSGPETRS
ncbi:MAG: hypothetical protein H7290_20950 [Flavobacterium sp.]|nr:hypothetical protein [Aeromicrobium sp.]